MAGAPVEDHPGGRCGHVPIGDIDCSLGAAAWQFASQVRPAPIGRITMTSVLSHSRILSLAVVGLLTAPWPLAAQQPPAGPPPAAQPAPSSTAAQPQSAPPPWAQGRPDTQGAANLAPVVPPPIAAAADKLPVAKLKLPKNFNIEVYASGLA